MPLRRVLFHGPLPGDLALLAREPGIEAREFRAEAWSLAPDEVGVRPGPRGALSGARATASGGLGEAADRIGLVQISDRLEPLHPFWEARPSFSLPGGVPAAHVSRRRPVPASPPRGAGARGARPARAAVPHRRDPRPRRGRHRAGRRDEPGPAAGDDPDARADLVRRRRQPLFRRSGGRGGDAAFRPGAERLAPPEVRARRASARRRVDRRFRGRTGETVLLSDARAIPEGAPYRFDAEFDERHGYRTHSVLAVPMSTPGGRTIGVLQLINRIRRVVPDGAVTAFIRSEVVPFDADHAEMARSLASRPRSPSRTAGLRSRSGRSSTALSRPR